MAREDLLDQCRAGARQSDDEDRVLGLAAPAAACFDELCREDRARATHILGRRRRVVGSDRAADSIALGVMIEGSCELLRVLQCLAEREVQVQAVVGGEVAAREL